MYKKALPWLTQLIVTALLPFSFLGLHFGNLSVLSWWDLNTFRRERWKCPAHPAPGLRWWCAWPASAASTRSSASTIAPDQPASLSTPTISFGLLSDRIAPFLSAVCFFWQFTGVWTEYRKRLTVLGSENHGPRRNCLQSQRAVGMLDCTYSFVWTLMNVWCFQACRTMLLGCFGLWDVVNHNYSADAESSLYMFIWMIVCIMLFSCVNGRLDQFIDVISEL